ncbi:MAG: aldehyde:ferredoxin oxidoreductase [Deltaproteobacteria bacterium]|nr:aldehyde:ferredoxin oxidoreductase [Deltaproteobacteria bacterium]MBW1951087.1 aldehyde:ferredoxin oxidoreductase [Deltaproteobacteria bacterium]MBW2009515.1 aldehyde:ferredoxin oxidoreductase [Deltaproteobacteria bacterium]
METRLCLEYEPHPVKRGYTDHILWVDLTAGRIADRTLPPEFKEKYVGGRGYALKLIWDETTARTRYDSPENLLVMAGGPLCNEPRFPGTGKFIVGTISPLTDTFVDSNIGGHFAPLLKQCGFDALVLTGLADREVILCVDGDRGVIEILEAPAFNPEEDWGALTYGEALLRWYNGGEPDENVAAVVNGEGSLHARFGIINSLFYDPRRKRIRSKQAGRGGTGTVMRTKGVRAVIVRSTLAKVNANRPADEQGVKEAGALLKKVVSLADPQQLRLASWGTPVLVEYMDKYHILPVMNYQYGRHPEAKAVFADVFLERYLTRKFPDGCYRGCNLACAKGAEEVTLEQGPRAGRRVGIDGPEYETAAAVTCMGIFDPQFIMEYNWYCDEYGLDTISMGVTASFLMECVQRGFLAQEDVGYPLAWGDTRAAGRLLHETARGEGFGKVCGQGVHRAKAVVADLHARRTGRPRREILAQLERFGMEMKGLEFSMYITKESLAQQGGYGFALKGPQHDEAWLIFIDQVHQELPTFEMKAQALKWFPLVRTWFNAVGLCKLPWIDVRNPEAARTENPARNLPSLDYYVKYLNATLGTRKTLQDVLDDSERLQLLQKMINVRHGKGSRESDRIPDRAMGPAFLNEYQARAAYYDEWLKERVGDEQLPGSMEERHALLLRLRREAYERLCDVVYREKGYTDEGLPLPETLEAFGLLDAKALELLESKGLTVARERALSN